MTPGLHLTPRHAKMIADRQKTLVVKPKKFDSNIRVPIFLCSKENGENGLVYAKIVLGDPKEIKLDEFWRLQNKHRVAEKEATRWWGITRKSDSDRQLYSYNVQVIETYHPPLQFEWRGDPGDFISSIEFIGKAPKELKMSEGRHSREKCMECDKPPIWEILWAEGIAHAWFCEKDFRKWLEERPDKIDDVNALKEVRNGIASEKFQENPNPNIWDKLKTERFKDLWDAAQKLKREQNDANDESKPGESTMNLKDISPSKLRGMSDDGLTELNRQLHSFFGVSGINKEDVLNAYLLLKQECKDRNIGLKIYDDALEAAAAKLQKESHGPIVPFVVTYQAVSLSGSFAYGADEPRDLDWVIRADEAIPVLEEALAKVFPGAESHFIYELKGPNWTNYPIGDFIISPDVLRENMTHVLHSRFPQYVDLGPYVFYREEGGVKKLRVNSALSDSGTRLKLERVFQDPFVEIDFSLDSINPDHERVIAHLYFRAYEEFHLQDMSEPEFVSFYRMKPRPFEEAAKAAKMAGEAGLKFGEWFPPIKVSTGYAPEQSMDPEEHWKYFVEPMIKRDGFVLLQQKFDGERMTLHVDKKSKTVKIFTEGSVEKKRQGLERSANMPDIEEAALKELKCDSAILDAEVTMHDEEGNPIPRHEITKLAVGKEPVKGEDIRFNCFDDGYLNGDLTPNDDYEKRLQVVEDVVPSGSKHFKRVKTYRVHNREEFDRAYKELSSLIGSEGAMSKTKKMPFFEKDGKTGEMAKLKVLFEVDVMVIGRRKVPAGKPAGKKVSADEMMRSLPDLKKKSSTWTFRCAFLGPDGKLWPLYSDKSYAPGDLTLKWDEERATWKGTEDPSEWEMMKEFPNSKEGTVCYGNTYNFSPAEGEPEPKLGKIMTVAPAIMRAWKSDGSVMVSWTFPKCRRLYPDANKPMNWEIINNVLESTAKRHGKEAEMKIEKGMKRVPFEEVQEENLIPTDFDEYLAEIKQPYASPGGKKWLVNRLVPLIPKHRKYVEPFGGAAALLFAKDPSEEEVYSDLQPEYPFILRTLKSASDEDLTRLRRKDWGGSKEKHKKFRMEGWRVGDKIERLYRILYLIKFGWGGYWTDKFGYSEKSVTDSFFDGLPNVRERLKGVKILNRDAYKLIPEEDGEDTFFYLDPPYDINFIVKVKRAFGGESTDLKRLATLCKSIKGKFMLSLNDSPAVRKAFHGFQIKGVSTRKTSAGYSTTQHKYTVPATTRKEVLIANYNMSGAKDLKEAKETHEAQREFSEEIFGDPYMVDAKGKTSEFVVQHHLRGIWTEKERKAVLEEIGAAKSQDELEKIWREHSCEYLLEPFEKWKGQLQAVDIEKQDITSVVNKRLTKNCPEVGKLEMDRVVQRGNVHTDLRLKVPGEKHLIGWTITDPRMVFQHLKSGNFTFPLRSKFLANQPGDKSPCTRKATQPESWFYLVDGSKPRFEAAPGEVGATAESGGVFLFMCKGRVAWGISKDDYHELYFWFPKPYEDLSGRWGFQKLSGGERYEKVPATWWMLDKPEKTQAPYILQHGRKALEEKARREGIKAMVYNPGLLSILRGDESGEKWLKMGISKDMTPAIIEKAIAEYGADGASWKR